MKRARSNPRGAKAPRRTPARRIGLVVALAALVVLAVGWKLFRPRLGAPMPRPEGASTSVQPATVMEDESAAFAAYGGSKSCQPCHEEAYELWVSSHHGMAERPLDPALDGPAFDPTRTFKHGSQQTRVGREGTNWMVTCAGLSKTNETHAVVRVIGHDPLRQFLVAFPGGRLQTLQASYAPGTNEWFDVYGDEDRRPGEWGHWTGRGMNWNYMCATCHNTRLRKNYDPVTDSYQTRMAEMTVGCEACHGPLKAHNEWQAKYGKTGQKDPTVTRLSREQLVDNCGFCHARRSDLTGDFKPGDRFFDHQSLAIVDRSNVYYPDGQVRDENYEFAAFLGSRMQTNGVACVDCHNPHSMKTVLPGNWLCLRCHNGSVTNAPVINPVEHSHHKVFGYAADGTLVDSDLMNYKPGQIKETGGECVNCHMPQTLYMQRHWRHDHGFTIPDPLLTKEHAIPNACNRCHADKSVDWAQEACVKWYGPKMERPTRTRAQWIARARGGDKQARDPLLELLRGTDNPYWRGVAAGLVGQWVAEAPVRNALVVALRDAHPLVREQAVLALEPLFRQPDGELRAALRPLLADPVRSVRVRAAWALQDELPPNTRAALELEHAMALNADQPAGQMQLGAHALRRGQAQKAVDHYARAVAWDGGSGGIRHDYAVALSLAGRPREAVEQLEAACRLEPKDAEYAYKLALAWNETGDNARTMATLEKAVALDPQHARAWFNLGLARNAAGQAEAAVQALLRAETVAPEEAQFPYARATIEAARGRVDDARRAAERALEIDPQFRDARGLLNQLGGAEQR